MSEPEFFVFNVYDKSPQRYLNFADALLVTTELGLKFVPLLEKGACFSYTKEDLLNKARGLYPGTKNHKEGDVWRCLDSNAYSDVLREDTTFKSRPRISFKVLNNKYLLKEE